MVGFVLLAFAAGWIGSVTQGDDVGARYLAFERPVWAPPQAAFGIVWPVLYLLIGIAGWRVWDVAGGFRAARDGARPVGAPSWSSTPSGRACSSARTSSAWRSLIILALDVVVIATIAAFRRHDRIAAALLLPYLVWILYATALNVALWRLN